jgi:hypothetical protein
MHTSAVPAISMLMLAAVDWRLEDYAICGLCKSEGIQIAKLQKAA